MFYSQDILQKHRGKFGLIWIAATHGTHLTRRDYESINLDKTCGDIINYITLRAPPRRHGGSRPRFSLYLSSQLMFGCVKILHRQEQYLIGDLTALSTRCALMISATAEIDLKPVNRKEALRSPINQADAFDPDFGILRGLEVVDVHEIPDIECWKVDQQLGDLSYSSPQHVSVVSTPVHVFRAELGSPHQSSGEDIRLTEKYESPTIEEIQVPGETELPPLDDEDPFKLVRDIAGMEMEIPEICEKEDLHAGGDGPNPDVTGDQTFMEVEQVLSPTERTPAPKAAPVEPPSFHQRSGFQSPGVTPISPGRKHMNREEKKRKWALDFPQTSPDLVSVPKRRRKRFLITDHDIQLPRSQVRENLSNPEELLGTNAIYEFENRNMKHEPASSLIAAPYMSVLKNRRLRKWWDANLKTKPEASTEEEEDIWTVPYFLATSSSDGDLEERTIHQKQKESEEHLMKDSQRKDDTSIEMGRDTSGLDRSRKMSMPRMGSLSSHSLIESDLSSASDMETSRKRSSQRKRHRTFGDEMESLIEKDETETAEEGISKLQVLPEEQSFEQAPQSPSVHRSVHTDVYHSDLELPPIAFSSGEDELAFSKELTMYHQTFLRSVNTLTSKGQRVSFKEVCPISNTKNHAAHMFASMLDLCKSGTVVAEQNVPYGNIMLSRGVNF